MSEFTKTVRNWKADKIRVYPIHEQEPGPWPIPAIKGNAEMTLAEQRANLIAVVGHYGLIDREQAMEIIAGISAEGLSIVGPEVTAEMREASGVWWDATGMFKAMLAAGDLAKPE